VPVLVRPKTLTAFALCLFLLAAILLTACTAEPPNKSRAPHTAAAPGPQCRPGPAHR